MLNGSKSKSAIGVLSLLLLVTLTPSANAGRSVIPTLNGSLCKAWAGTWNPGKSPSCVIGPSANLDNLDSVIINAKTSLILQKNITLIGTLENQGTINNFSTFTIKGLINNNGNISNEINGSIINEFSINNTGTITNYNTIRNGDGWYTEIINNGTILNYKNFTNYSTGRFRNNGGLVNQSIGSEISNASPNFYNVGTIILFGDGVSSGTRLINSGTITNTGTVTLSGSGYTVTNSGTIINNNTWYPCVNDTGTGGTLISVPIC